ncbi:neuron navigator 2-like isoform X4 [Sycon ciliatum]|uniref:neuron navigator 2-like isoform X4 n=1 Tax=Sycon ciliatum TaxID=27933 RepID=UPI0031F66BA3
MDSWMTVVCERAGVDVTSIRHSPSSEADKLQNIEKCLQAVKESGIAVPDTTAKEIIQGKAEKLIEVFTAMSKVSTEHQRRVIASPAASALPTPSKMPSSPVTGLKQRIPVAASTTQARSPQLGSKLPAGKSPLPAPAAVQSPTTAETSASKLPQPGLPQPKQTKLTIPSRKVRSFSQVNNHHHVQAQQQQQQHQPQQQQQQHRQAGTEADVSASTDSSPEKAETTRRPPVAVPARTSSNAVFSPANISTASTAAAAASQADTQEVGSKLKPTGASSSQLRKPSSAIGKPAQSNPTQVQQQLQQPAAIPTLKKMSPRPSPKSSPQHQMVIRSYSEEPISPGRQRKANGDATTAQQDAATGASDRAAAGSVATSKPPPPASGLKKPGSRTSAAGEKVHRTQSCSTAGLTSPSSNDERPLTRAELGENSPKLVRPGPRSTVPILACTNNSALRKPTVVHTSDSDSSPSHKRTFNIRALPPPASKKSSPPPHTDAGAKHSTTADSPDLIASERPHDAADGKSNSSSDSEGKPSSSKRDTAMAATLLDRVSHIDASSATPSNSNIRQHATVEDVSQSASMSFSSAHVPDTAPTSHDDLTANAQQHHQQQQQPFSPMNIALLSLSNNSSPRHSPQSSSLSDSAPACSPPLHDSVLSSSSAASSQENNLNSMKTVMQSASPLAAVPEVSGLGSRDNPVRTSWRRSSNAPRGGSKPSIAAATGFRQPLPMTNTQPSNATSQPQPTPQQQQPPPVCASPNQDPYTAAAAAATDGVQATAQSSQDWDPSPLQRGRSFSARSEARRSHFPRRLSSDNILDSTTPDHSSRRHGSTSQGGSSSDESPMATVTNSSRAAVSFRPRARTVPAQHFQDLKPTTGNHRDSGVSMTGLYSNGGTSGLSDSPLNTSDGQAKQGDAKQRHPSDTSSSTSTSPAMDRYTLAQANSAAAAAAGAAASNMENRLPVASPVGMVMSPHRSLHGSKKSLSEQKMLEARLSELEDRNSQLQNEVVNTTRAMSQLQDIIQKKDSEVTTVLQAFKTKEEELDHIYTLLRTVAPNDWTQAQASGAQTTDDVPVRRVSSPLVAQSSAAAAANYKSVTWDESSMTVAMALEKSKDKKKKKSWKPFKLESFRKGKKRTSSGSNIGGDESENNDDVADESPAHEPAPLSAAAQEELQRVRNELQLAKAELSRMQISSLISKPDVGNRAGDFPTPSADSMTSSQLASSSGRNSLEMSYLDTASSPTKTSSDMCMSSAALPCDFYVTVDTHRTYAGRLSVTMASTWPQMDKMVAKALVNHAKAIDPVQALGLTRKSMRQYRIAGIVRKPTMRASESEDDLLPDDLLSSERRADVEVTLKGAADHDCDELAYSTVIPKALLKSYLSLVEDQPVIITGPTSCGKSFLGRHLLKHILARHGADVSQAILTTCPPRNITTPPQLEQHVKKVVEHFCKKFSEEQSASPIGLFIEDLDNTSCLDRHALASLRRDGKRRVYVIITASRWPVCSNVNTAATRVRTLSSSGEHMDASQNDDNTSNTASSPSSSSTPDSHASLTSSQCASIRLVTHHEPVKGLLARYLNKRRISLQACTSGGDRHTTSVYEWLPSAWEHINTFLHSIVSPHAVLGPCQYLTCPSDSQEAARWFSSLWNFHVLPYVIEAATWPLAPPLVQQDWYSPVTWLTESSPWNNIQYRNSGIYLTNRSTSSTTSDLFAMDPATAVRALDLETLRQEDMLWHTPRAVAIGNQPPLSAMNLPHELLPMEKKNGLIPGTTQEDRLMRLLERVVMTSTPPPNSR